jgi:tryptophan synthase alpha chain
LRDLFERPVLVGFGIDSGASARRLLEAARGAFDGVVVGTAIVKCIERARTLDEAKRNVRALVSEIRAALDD